eukprot:CCRYP_019793-RB/>CCRYP_019793-RB protein AED:0.03 eAED:0.02 QI:0/0/0/1/0/0/2/0/728
MATLEFVRTYLDDLLCISKGSLEDHLNKLRRVFIRLRDAGLTVNARTSSFCAVETEYLGYVLSRDGIKPQPKKVQAILALTPPQNVKQLRRFLGTVQYYRDIWARRSEILAPLTNLEGNKTKKKPWHWDSIHQQAFDIVKATIACDVTLAYPDYSQGFEIYTDSSKFQLGAVITQNNRPLAFFSRKLSQAQQKYSVTEQELKAIVETLKEVKGMLWGQQITVYTDHKNLMQDALGLTCDRVYRWRLFLEEYGSNVVYIKGIHNTVADAISRLDYGPVANDRSTWMTFAQCWCYHNTAQSKSSLATTKESMNQVFANRNKEDSIYPLTTREIAEAQQEDAILLNKGYSTHLVENIKVLYKDGKMVIPKSLHYRAVAWFHHYLQRPPGTKRLKETLRLSMYWKGLRKTVQSHIKKCHSCQVNKQRQFKYGKLPTKLAITNPWEALCVDLIGPCTLKGKDKTQIDFMCITMINPATSWFEIVELPVSQLQELDIPTGTKGQRSKDTHVQTKQPYFDKTSATVGNIINRTWFSCYPYSQYILYDNGSEFKLHFETLCDSYGLKPKPTSVRNPQANAILERVHQTIMSMLRTADLDMADTISESDIADYLTNAAWVVRSTYHTVLKTSPGAAIFGRDMSFDIPYIADWSKIGEYRQRQTDKNTRRENASGIDWDYQPGDKVLLQKDGILRKTESRYESDPWTITSVHTNGTVRVQRGTKSERLNIRRVTPYFE